MELVVVKAFWRLLKGATFEELASLFGYYDRLHQFVFVFDNSFSAARKPEHGELPWPILLMLANRSKKHIELNSKYFLCLRSINLC